MSLAAVCHTWVSYQATVSLGDVYHTSGSNRATVSLDAVCIIPQVLTELLFPWMLCAIPEVSGKLLLLEVPPAALQHLVCRACAAWWVPVVARAGARPLLRSAQRRQVFLSGIVANLKQQQFLCLPLKKLFNSKFVLLLFLLLYKCHYIQKKHTWWLCSSRFQTNRISSTNI